MRDRLSREKRSWNMSRIRGKGTAPEMAVRSLLHRMGYRFRLHSGKLLGRPDIVLPKLKAVVFVHGCFWHRHTGCRNCTTPTNPGPDPTSPSGQATTLKDSSVSFFFKKLPGILAKTGFVGED